MLGAISNTCNDGALSGVLYSVKNILFLIQVIVPILLIVWSGYEFFRLVMNPDEKDLILKPINITYPLLILFVLLLLIKTDAFFTL